MMAAAAALAALVFQLHAAACQRRVYPPGCWTRPWKPVATMPGCSDGLIVLFS